MPVIGFLSSSSSPVTTKRIASFNQGLSETGYVAGRDVMIEPRLAGGQYDRLPALAADIVTRQVNLIAALGTSVEYIGTGKVRASVTTAVRLEALPDVPTVGDFVPGYEASTWYAVGAPRSTSPEIVEKLNRQINAAVADPIIKTRLVEQGGTVFHGSPTDFEKLIAEDTAKWAKVIRGANIKPE